MLIEEIFSDLSWRLMTKSGFFVLKKGSPIASQVSAINLKQSLNSGKSIKSHCLSRRPIPLTD